MKIECTLEVFPPESQHSSRRITLTASGQVVFNAYEHAMSSAEKLVTAEILAAHAKAFHGLSESIRPKST